jgi:hypothetical protein
MSGADFIFFKPCTGARFGQNVQNEQLKTTLYDMSLCPFCLKTAACTPLFYFLLFTFYFQYR